MPRSSLQAPASVVMIRPHHFTPNTETAQDNHFQTSATTDAASVAQAAQAEVTRAAEALQAAGIRVHLFEDEGTTTPDSVFPNNWFSTHSGGHVAIYPMYSPNRRSERRQDVLEVLKRDYRVQDIIDYSGLEQDDLFLEGTGAMVIDHLERVAYAARSRRTSEILLERFCTHFNYEPVVFDAVDAQGEPIYHTNVLVCIGTDFAMIGLDSITDAPRRREVAERLRRGERDIIELSHAQIADFAGNAIELQGNDGLVLALSSRALRSLDASQRATLERHVTLLPLDIPTIEHAGGSVRCIIAGLHLSARTPEPSKDFTMLPQPSKLAYVPFVSVEHMMGLVHHIGIERVLTDLAAEIEADFRRWTLFDKTPRVASHSDVGVIELMPTSDGQTYGFKYVNGHPKNTTDGLQTVTAFGLLADVDSGYPKLLSEMTFLTALRTAATSAMAAKHLAPKGARTMAMIGNGAQSEFQCLAFKAVCGIDTVRLYDIDASATARCAKNLAQRGLKVVQCQSGEEAMTGAQIITTCTADKQYATILTDNMVGAGVHINAIGGDCPGKTELHRDILRRSSIFVEYPPQTRIEGEIQQLDPDHAVTELWQVIEGQASGRTDDKQITLFDSVGFAIEDFSALQYVSKAIKGTQFYEQLDMIADPDDPRDLFGMFDRANPQNTAA